MNSDLEECLKAVEHIWPELKITKENLVRPTPDYCIRFYMHFLKEFQEQIQSLTGPYFSPLELNLDHLEPEERLFVLMSEIFQPPLLKFTLSDIYEPAPVRTKCLFYVCAHIVAFIDGILQEVEKPVNDVLKMKDLLVSFAKEQESLLVQIDEKAKKKSELMDNVDESILKLQSAKEACEQVRSLKLEKDKIYSVKKKQLETHQRELQKEEYELKSLESVERSLSEQTITQSEYENLFAMAKNLESEIQSLGTDDINMEDCLQYANDEIMYYQECLRKIPNISDFRAEVLCSLSKCDEVLRELQTSNEKLSSIKHNSLKSVKCQNEKKVAESKERMQKLLDHLQNVKIVFSQTKVNLEQDLLKLRDNIKSKRESSLGAKKTYMEDIDVLTREMESMKKAFAQEYVKLVEAEKLAKEHFRSIVIPLTQCLNESSSSKTGNDESTL